MSSPSRIPTWIVPWKHHVGYGTLPAYGSSLLGPPPFRFSKLRPPAAAAARQSDAPPCEEPLPRA